MNNYYKILGLEEGASQQDIKKAYFKLVRQYSPESDPEKFQQIRKAYEQLKKSPQQTQGPSFSPFSSPYAEKMMRQIHQYRTEKNIVLYRDACEEAVKKFPDDLPFLYHLVIAQRRCKNTGKAVRNAELLIKKEPENKWFQRELAFSYMERGFTQKAFCALKTAYALGCRDLDFILTYANACRDSRKYDIVLEILLEVIRGGSTWTKEQMPDLTEVYIGLLYANFYTKSSCLSEILESFYQFLKQYYVYVKEVFPEFSLTLIYTCSGIKQPSREYGQLEQIFSLMLRVCTEEKNKQLIQNAIDRFSLLRMTEDPRISDTMVSYLKVCHDKTCDDEMYLKFLCTDYQLCMLEERDTFLKQAQVIQKDYPDEYAYIEEFIRKLENSAKINLLKDRLLKIYYQLEPFFDGGTYYDKYPQEQTRAKGTLITNGFPDEPYVRLTKKIGRNDPCPCGSGKKYKHCCMNAK